MGTPDDLELKTLMHELIFVKLLPATINNGNGADAMRNVFVRRERKQQIH